MENFGNFLKIFRHFVKHFEKILIEFGNHIKLYKSFKEIFEESWKI